MARMRMGLVHTLAWSLATGAAVTLSWWGVHSVMAGTAYDPPRALPLPVDSATEQGASPVASSTWRPPSPSAKPPSPPSAAPGDSERPSSRSTAEETKDAGGSTHGDGGGYGDEGAGTGGTGTGAGPGSGPGSDSSGASGEVKGYTVDGGRVVFDIGSASAELVSATPDSGWQMQVWTQPAWIRVTFTRDGREVSVFCTWNGHPPMVQFDDR
ncbi:hypothetical protein [Streptomyces sp. NPDC056937]|uniref:hypothetical protein n=1 Tax=Streptomyces sp. NPDC056937 TaxID=3345969 RepID=UPI0036396842